MVIYFVNSVFSPNTGKYGNLLRKFRIQSKYRKIRTRKNSVFGHFSRSDNVNILIKSVASKNKNNYYYNIFFKKGCIKINPTQNIFR